jgi:hypothetical protein
LLVIRWTKSQKGKEANIIKFVTNNLPQCNLSIGCKDKLTEKTVVVKFFGSLIKNNLNWKNHNKKVISKLSEA